jgi:hypothetical protein
MVQSSHCRPTPYIALCCIFAIVVAHNLITHRVDIKLGYPLGDAPPPSVAVCVLAKNENIYIREWIQHHLQLGVTKF